MDGGFFGVITRFLDRPSVWTLVAAIVVLVYFWRRDVSNPEKGASSSVLTGIAEHATTAYTTVAESISGRLDCEGRFEALLRYTRRIQVDLTRRGGSVPPMPDEVFDHRHD